MFSIIIRVKNEERWIGHTIQSVLDFIPENEIIIVDNNSSDRSIEIANTFKKNNNLNSEGSKYTSINILNIDEYTPGKSLNYGVSHAKFENILVISSHCVLKKFNLNSVLERLKDYPAIFGKQTPIYDGKRITARYIWSHFGDEETENMFSELEDRYFFHNAVSVFKKELLIDIPFDEELVGKEDRYWAQTIIDNGYKFLYDPVNISCDHHYTEKGNTWKGVG